MLGTTYIAANHDHQDFRLFIQGELMRRCKLNPKYSMRAFARTLGLESSELSKILKGKRGISRTMFQKIAQQLQLSPEQMSRYKQSETKHSKRIRKSPASVVALSYEQLSQDVFQSIADWYHYAILELVATTHFRAEPRWIARCLGISVSEVNVAIERLQRLQMLEISSDGKWIDRSNSVTNISGPFTNTAKRLLQKQILAQGIQAIDDVALEKRDNTSMTMAIDSTRLPKAREMIKEFRRELCAFLQDSDHKDSVYQLGVALFPATTSLSKGEGK